MNNPVKKWGKHVTREDIQMANKHNKRRSVSYVIGNYKLISEMPL